MQLGFNLPISGPTSGARSFARLAQEGEAMGYDYLTLTDHVVLPDVSVPGYPYSEFGRVHVEYADGTARAADGDGVHCGKDLADPVGAGGAGGAASASSARGKDAVHD